MKKIISFIVALYIAMAIIMPVMTVYATQVDTEAAPFDFSKPIRVGYYSTFENVIVDIDSLNNKGYGYEVFDAISERSGLEFEFVPISDSMFEAVNSGYVDVGGFNTQSAERREQVLYSQNPYTKTYISLTSKDLDIRYSDLSAIDGKTISVFDESVGIAYLDTFCEENNISVEYVYGESATYLEQDTDLYLVYSESKTYVELNNILNLGVYNMFLITSFENAQLMEVIDSHFLDVIYTEGNLFMELEEKYLSDNIEMSHRGLTQEEVEILQQKTLEAGYITGYAPISYMNDNGEPDGVLVDVLNSYAERYDFEVNYHPYNIEDPHVERENFDILVTLYGDIEQARDEEYYTPTVSFYDIPMYAIVNNEYMNTTVKEDIMKTAPKIGMLPYQTIDFEPFLAAYPLTELVTYNVWHDLLDDLAAGNVDMVFCTESATTYTELYLDDVEISTMITDTVTPMKFYINNAIADEYVPIFNIMADRFSSRTYEAIIEYSANDAIPKTTITFLEFVTDYWYYFAILFFIITASFIALYYRGVISKKEALLKSYDIDPMTGLITLNKFREIAGELRSKIKPGEYEIISFDIDMFKTINTHFSQERGTTVLIAIADALKTAFESTNAVICRRIADQFLIFRRIDEGGSIRHIYNNDILPAIEENTNEKYKVSLSFGTVVVDNIKAKVTELLGQADSARLEGKSIHRTTFITFDDKMKKQYEDKINITFRMEQALKDREFVVEYQPKINFKTLKTGGAEALVRWNPRIGNKIYPDQFIPVFEENGFISDLDLYVLDEVCKYIKANHYKMDIPRISVNLSAHTVLSDNIVKRVSEILSFYEIDNKLIELELTESAVEANTEKFLSTVKSLKKLGLAISIDDFGAGVSSLNRLSAVEADILKLDKAFFDESEKMGKSMIVVTDIIRMAKRLSMKVVAEGVETASQAKWLQNIGCDYAQGYYFAKPMNTEDFKNLLIEQKQFSINLE